ncbi:MAG: hypothetical protein QM831_02095 [Kofleriaceae bacterium]
MRSVVLCLLLSACGSKSDKPAESGSAAGSPRGAAALKKMGELRDVACKCKDKSCIDRVNAAVAKWSADDQKTNGPMNYSETEGQQMAQIGQEMGACIQQVIAPVHGEGP